MKITELRKSEIIELLYKANIIFAEATNNLILLEYKENIRFENLQVQEIIWFKIIDLEKRLKELL